MPTLSSLEKITTSSFFSNDSFPSMSTELFLQLLFSGKKDFRKWDLGEVDFAQIHQDAKQTNRNISIFSGLDFSDAIFPMLLRNLDFSGCKFIGANLEKADLKQSVLNSADLSHANLNQAELSDAECIGANFFNATLKHVKGTHVSFSKANLKQVKLNGAYLFESVFIDADLANAELSFINLEGSDLTCANLFQAKVDNAKLIETIWFESYLKNVNFRKSDLTGAILAATNLQEALLTRANLQQAQLMDADLFGADLRDSNLRKADLSRANLTKAIFHFANLDYANLRGAKLNGMSLLHTNVTGVNLETTPIDQVNLNHWRPWYGPTYAWSLVKEENLKKYPVRIPIFALTSQESPTAFLSRCLPTQWDPLTDCEIFWNDVDRVVANHTCVIDQIVVKSESLMSEIRNSKETKRQQWLQLAEAVKLTGNINVVNTVKDLIKFEKIAVLLPKYKQYIVSRSEELKNSTTVKNAFLNFKEKTILHRELLFNRPIDLEPLSENNNTALIFNTTLFDINTFSITKNNASYAISIDFLSSEIRELLEITQAISIYKWLSSPETLFFYQLKSDSNLIESSRNWLRGTLNASEYSRMLIKYPEIFNPCQFSCNNLTISNPTLIRYMLTQLVSPTNFKRPIVNVVRNVSAVLPYKTVLKFSHAELMLEDEQNWLGHITSHLSITEIIDSYLGLVNRLKISLMVTNSATHEVTMFGSNKDQWMHNSLTDDCHIVGDGKVVISGYDRFNRTQLPLPAVTLYGSKETGTRLIDFQILARQIQENFNSSLSVKLVTDNNDLIIQRFFQISSQTTKKNISVISIHLKNALVDRWYQNLEIILNTAATKITGRGLKMQIKPTPCLFPASNNNVDFLSLARLEKNSAVIIPARMDQDSFFRIEDGLTITNVLTRGLESEKPYFLVLWDLYKQPEKATHTLEFTNKKVVLAEKLNEIFNLSEDWDYSLNQHKKNLYAMATQVGIRDGYVMRDKDACRERKYLNSYDTYRFKRSALLEQTAKKVDHAMKSNLTKTLTETDLVLYSKKAKNDLEKIEIMLPLPVSAWIAGLISAHFDHVVESYQEKCPSLPAYMTYGFKPFLSALISSACNYVLFDQDEEIEEKFARFFTYFMLNFLGVIAGQPLTQKIAETIHNKLMCFFVQSLTWALLWNPSLFASEYLEIIPVVCMQLLQGLFFKTGEETYTLAKKTCNSPSSFWRKKAPKSADEDQVLNNGEIEQVQVAFA
ncbi:pentapeptide repeat-containing protein [Rickettsiella endosymbiont of Aleochara curtula]|uniref:pentapeptide repeat-containing protein n=1 Tax=Rickettsiella endosymbiont of Aleochara curtula TaxID=3077936 RepID=UPI00313B7DE8